MGRYAIILVTTLVLLLTYFVISTTNTSRITVDRNIDAFEYNKAKNIAYSAAQIVIENVINPKSWVWKFDIFYPTGNISVHPLMSFATWEDLDGRYKIDNITKPDHNNLIITVSGESNDRVYDTRIHFRKIEESTTLFDYAAYSKYDLSIYPQGYINSFNSDDPVFTPTNDAKVGYGPDGVFSNAGEIHGTVSHKVDKDMPVVPDPGGGNIITIPNNSHTITAGDYRVENNVNLSGNTVVQFSGGHTNLYLEANLRLTGNSKLILNSGASLKIYISGSLDNRGNGIFNETGVAENLIIYGTETCTDVNLQGSNNTTFTGVVYAPEADIDIYGTKFTLKGAILGKNIKIRCSLFYDEALSELESSEIVTARYYVLSWQ
jgi:hypothetical protein